jgi:hypothetical protein
VKDIKHGDGMETEHEKLSHAINWENIIKKSTYNNIYCKINKQTV